MGGQGDGSATKNCLRSPIGKNPTYKSLSPDSNSVLHINTKYSVVWLEKHTPDFLGGQLHKSREDLYFV